jgi:Fusaric acid resistance protein family
MGLRLQGLAGGGPRTFCRILAAAGRGIIGGRTVAILAQPTRGAALAKAVNRIAATLIGASMSVVIAGLFPGERIGVLGASVCWICICVFVASYLRGYQAYAAVLSGYTVAIIALTNIDTPQDVFTTMTDRMAAIAIGILFRMHVRRFRAWGRIFGLSPGVADVRVRQAMGSRNGNTGDVDGFRRGHRMQSCGARISFGVPDR